MQLGEVYRNSWLSYGEYEYDGYISLTYAHPNGMQIDGAVMEYDGVKRYMQCNTSFPILADEKDYTMQYGCIAFRPGYVGPFVDVSWGSYYDTDFHIVTWESETPEICTVDENGILTALAPGFAQIKLTLTDQEGGGYYSKTYINVCISDEVRVPDYTDHAPCEHSYVPNGEVAATCESWGYEIHICKLCGAQTEVYTDAPPGHSYTAVTVKPTCTEGGYTTYTCSRCGDGYTEELPIDPEGHAWSGTECTLCGDTRLTPFDDVVESSFYEPAVAWAVEKNITKGISATTFGPTNTCNRAQVVTFLWRAVDCPKPQSTETPFVDVTGGFYRDAVLWAVENRITNGTDATHFGPGNACNRATVVTFLWRAAGKPEPKSTENPFTDVAKGSFYEKAVLWAVEKGITRGLSSTRFGPNAACNRATVVTFLYRAFGK